MIGHANLLAPSATTTSPGTPHTAPQEPQSAHAEARDAHREGEADGQSRAGRPPAHEHRPSHAQAAGRSARAARRGRDAGQDGDDTPARDAFARLLDQAPAPVDAKPAAPTPTPTASPQAAASPAHDAKPASLPDQLLGLLASLAPGAPGAAAIPATTVPPAAAATPAQSPAAPIAASAQGKPAAPTVGADAAGALLPALQDTPGAVTNAAATATASLAAAVHGQDTAAALPALHDAQRQDTTPAPTPFDALVHATAPTAADVPRPVVPATPTPVAQPADPRAGYGEELGSSVVWMADQRISHAEVRVVPDHLGPIDVKLQLDGAQVHATFLSAQPEVRHALEASLPRLRDLLGQHGLQLAQADVGQRQSDPRAARGGSQATADSRDAGDDGLATMTAAARTRVVRGLLDEYA